jgi:hypothetical protein
MSNADGVAAHLILGPREEPFLAPLLASIERAAALLIVNDNGPDPSPHAAALAESAFGRENRIAVDRTPFEGFAAARNVCLRVHRERAAGQWVMFVDADEVHGEMIDVIAGNLHRVPNEYDFVDAYTWHFFQSFEYYTSIERRMMFFRFRDELRWEGAVHEHLVGDNGKRIALPYVYGHYGHTLEPRRHAEKGRHYSSLGAPGNVLREEQLGDFDVKEYFTPVWPRLLHFRGEHPPAARALLQRLGNDLKAHHELTQRIVCEQPGLTKAVNLLRQVNYELRWHGRAFNRLARLLVDAS